MTKQERCPKCGSTDKGIRLCGNVYGGPDFHAPVLKECRDCDHPWHTQAERVTLEGSDIAPTETCVVCHEVNTPFRLGGNPTCSGCLGKHRKTAEFVPQVGNTQGQPEQTTSEREREIRAKEFWDRLPHCAHYPTCDGDLVGESHSAECPLYKLQRDVTMFEFADLYSQHVTASLRKDNEALTQMLRKDVAELEAEKERAEAAEKELARVREALQEATVCPTCEGEGTVVMECGGCLGGPPLPHADWCGTPETCPQCDGTKISVYQEDNAIRVKVLAALQPQVELPAKGEKNG